MRPETRVEMLDEAGIEDANPKKARDDEQHPDLGGEWPEFWRRLRTRRAIHSILSASHLCSWEHRLHMRVMAEIMAPGLAWVKVPGAGGWDIL